MTHYPNPPGDSSEANDNKLAGCTWNVQQTTLSVTKDTNNPPSHAANEESDNDSDSEGRSPEMNTPDDPVEDPLKRLDEGLPDHFGYNHQEFDLASQFDIQRYVGRECI
jgi:hypothetical protein